MVMKSQNTIIIYYITWHTSHFILHKYEHILTPQVTVSKYHHTSHITFMRLQ